jgi:hypothetical protein
MNPDLRLIGAHLGSMESDLDRVAQHVDRYPNFAVDLAGRVSYPMIAPRASSDRLHHQVSGPVAILH